MTTTQISSTPIGSAEPIVSIKKSRPSKKKEEAVVVPPPAPVVEVVQEEVLLVEEPDEPAAKVVVTRDTVMDSFDELIQLVDKEIEALRSTDNKSKGV